MKKSKDFLAGLVFGIIIFILPGLLTGSGGILGWDFFKNKILLSSVYIIASIIIYLVYRHFWDMNTNKMLGYFVYLLGVLTAFLLFILLGILALSKGTFGL